jgi:hypothetical protein
MVSAKRGVFTKSDFSQSVTKLSFEGCSVHERHIAQASNPLNNIFFIACFFRILIAKIHKISKLQRFSGASSSFDK